MTDVERFRQITTTMADLFEKKNANYGSSFSELFKELGPISGLVPLHNKLNRITTLTKGGHNDFESLEDSVTDLANYAVMFLIELQKQKDENTYIKKMCVSNFHADEAITDEETVKRYTEEMKNNSVDDENF